MKNNFETKFTGWSFIVAALLLWGGWFLSPHHIGEYIKDSDFSAVNEHLWYWIWMYRIHIFGWVAMAIALFALIGANVNKPSRVLVLPGGILLQLRGLGCWYDCREVGCPNSGVYGYYFTHQPVCYLFCSFWACIFRDGIDTPWRRIY
jgi:hypothetical protein